MPPRPLNKMFLFIYMHIWVDRRQKMPNIFVVVDLLSLKLMIFRVIILERSECTR